MTTLEEAADGIHDRLRTIAGLNVPDEPTPDQINYPAAFVSTWTIADESNDLDAGSYTVVFDVVILVSSAVSENKRALLRFTDPRSVSSVFQAINADGNLGGLDVTARAESVRGLTFDEVAGYQAWGQTVQIRVFVS